MGAHRGDVGSSCAPTHPAPGSSHSQAGRGKASQPARPAPNELCRAQHRRQHPPAQRSEDALPTLLGTGAGAAQDRSGIRIRLMWPFDVAAWQTGHGSHPVTAGPGRGPARCHTLTRSSPATLPRTQGAGGAVGAGSPGAPVTASSRHGNRSGPVLGIGTLLKFSPGMHGTAPAAPLEVESEPAASLKAKASRRLTRVGGEARLWPGLPAHRSPPSWELSAPAPAHRCQQESSAPQGTANSEELARVQHRTLGRTRHNTHRTINPRATGPRTSRRLCRTRRGPFPGGKVIFSLALAPSRTTTGAGGGPAGYRG